MLIVLTEGLNLCSYASDVTSGLSDGYEGQSEKGSKSAARRTAAKLFKRRARSRLRITGVQSVLNFFYCNVHSTGSPIRPVFFNCLSWLLRNLTKHCVIHVLYCICVATAFLLMYCQYQKVIPSLLERLTTR